MTRSDQQEVLRPASGPSADAPGDEAQPGDDLRITGMPTWVRTADDTEGALAAWVHAGPSPVQGVLIMAPPLGREHVISYRTVRTACCRAAEEGLAAVRFDWTGHGDSREWRPGEDLAARWAADLDAVIDRAREAVPGAPVTVLGMRLGASVVAASRWAGMSPERREQAGVALAAWAPVSGRHFLREHAALRRISLPDVPPAEAQDGVEISGDLLDPEHAASIRALRAPQADAGPLRVLRAQPGDELAWAAAFRYARVPEASVQLMLDEAVRGDDGWEARWPLQSQTVQPVRGGSEDQVLETWTAVGEHGLWGVLSEPAQARPRRAVVLTAPDAEPRHGPSRLWTRISRPLALGGCSVMRADRRGTGDNADPTSLTEPNPYTEDTVTDVEAAIRHQRARVDGPVTVAGLCAGAWAVARAAQNVAVDELIMVNNAAWSPDPLSYRRLYTDSPLTAALGGGEELAQAPGSPRARLYRALKMVHRRVQIDAPGPFRRLGQRLCVLQDATGLLPGGLKAARVSVWSTSGDLESLAKAGGRRALRHWRSSGLSVEVRPLTVADHALLSASGREEVSRALEARLNCVARSGQSVRSVRPGAAGRSARSAAGRPAAVR